MAISVTYYEANGWPKDAYTIDGFAGERKLVCDWGDRHTLATEIMTPPNNIYPYNDIGAMVTHIPRVEGWRKGKQSAGTTAGMASYEKAVVTVNYSTFGVATGTTPNQLLISEWTETWSEVKTLDKTKYFWGTAPKNLGPGEGPSKLEPGMDYILVYHNLLVVPGAVTTVPGTCNSNVVNAYLLGLSFPAETLVFDGANVKHRITTTGSTGYTVRYRFRFKPNVRDGEAKGWNWQWNANKGHDRYEQLYDEDGDVKKTYTPTTFSF